MPIKQIFDTQDAVPEFLKTAVVEQDGKWVFEAETVAEVGNLKNTLKKERDSRTKFEAEVKKFERFKPLTEAEEDEVEQFLERWNKRNDPDPGKKADPAGEQAKQLELKDKLHAKELKKRDEELARIKADYEKAGAELRDFKLWTPLREVAIKAGLTAGDWEIARLDLSHQARFGFDDDGRIVVMEDGMPSSVTPEKFFKEVYSDMRPKFYAAQGAGGSGAPAHQGGGKGVKTISADDRDAINNNLEAIAKGEVVVQ